MSQLVRVHSMELPANHWWACQRLPGRPNDPGQVFDEHCPLCQRRAAALMAAFGDMPVFDAGTAEKSGKLSDLVGWGLVEWPR